MKVTGIQTTHMIMGITIIMGITRITIITIHPVSMDITGGTVVDIMAIGIIVVGATLEEVTLEEVTTGNQSVLFITALG